MATKDESTAPLEPDPRTGDPLPLDFRSAVQALLARRRPKAGGHPPAIELRDYGRRRLAVRPADELREHLSVCRRCSRLLLALAGLPDIRQVRPPLGRRSRRE
jgi:hypothetical protein